MTSWNPARRLLAALCSASLLAACGSGSSASNDGPPPNPNPNPTPTATVKPPVSALLNANARAIFVGAISSAAGASAKALWQMDPTGAVTSVSFRDEDAREVRVDVKSVAALGDDLLALELRYADALAIPHDVRALWRRSDGRIFDLSGYDVTNGQLKGDHLFAISSPFDETATLFDLDVSTLGTTIAARPMSDPRSDPITVWPEFYVDGDRDVVLRTSGTGYAWETFFHDDAAPVKSPGSFTFSVCPSVGNQLGQLASVYGEDGALYVFCVEGVPLKGSAYTDYLRYFVQRVDFTSTGISLVDPVEVRTVACPAASWGIVCSESRIDAKTPYGLQSRSRFVPLSTGFFTMLPVLGGGISISWTNETFPFMVSPRVAGSFMYWKDHDTIRRIAFAPGAAPQEVTTATNIIDFQVAHGIVFFTRYETGTSVGTYEVKTPGAAAVKLTSDDLRIQQIVELR